MTSPKLCPAALGFTAPGCKAVDDTGSCSFLLLPPRPTHPTSSTSSWAPQSSCNDLEHPKVSSDVQTHTPVFKRKKIKKKFYGTWLGKAFNLLGKPSVANKDKAFMNRWFWKELGAGLPVLRKTSLYIVVFAQNYQASTQGCLPLRSTAQRI